MAPALKSGMVKIWHVRSQMYKDGTKSNARYGLKFFLFYINTKIYLQLFHIISLVFNNTVPTFGKPLHTI